MSKHIGIVACSAEGAALCYRTICDEAPALMGRHMHPEITHAHPLSRRVHGVHLPRRLAGRCRPDAVVGRQAGQGGRRLPDLSRQHHPSCLRPGRAALAAAVAAHRGRGGAVAKARGFRKLAITGTKYTMEGTVYQTKLPAAGIEYLVPDADERARIDQIIFDELVNGIFTAESRTYFQQVIGRMSHAGLRRGGAGLHGDSVDRSTTSLRRCRRWIRRAFWRGRHCATRWRN